LILERVIDEVRWRQWASVCSRMRSVRPFVHLPRIHLHVLRLLRLWAVGLCWWKVGGYCCGLGAGGRCLGCLGTFSFLGVASRLQRSRPGHGLGGSSRVRRAFRCRRQHRGTGGHARLLSLRQWMALTLWLGRDFCMRALAKGVWSCKDSDWYGCEGRVRSVGCFTWVYYLYLFVTWPLRGRLGVAGGILGGSYCLGTWYYGLF
jgi:hypothetical protein